MKIKKKTHHLKIMKKIVQSCLKDCSQRRKKVKRLKKKREKNLRSLMPIQIKIRDKTRTLLKQKEVLLVKMFQIKNRKRRFKDIFTFQIQ